MPRWHRTPPIAVVVAALLLAAPAGAAARVRAERTITVPAPAPAALAQPTVGFELRDVRGRPLEAGEDELLGGLLGSLGAVAVLDTGASGYVLSGATAARYGIAPERGSRYVEVGMTGEHAMSVSRPYTIALCDGAAPPSSEARGRMRRSGGCAAVLTARAQRFLVNGAGGDLASLLASPGATVDVVGMPAIRELIVEITPAAGSGGAVVLNRAGARVGAEVWLPLRMRDFNQRRHPQNRGPLPSLAGNPLVAVRARHGGRETRGEWLLDTGAAVTILATPHARALGLVDGRGQPTRPPDFRLPVGGIAGAHTLLAGFRVERLEIEAEDGVTLVVPAAPVLVHDITATPDGGGRVLLDGVLGMNVAASFRRMVIDGPRARLGLDPRP